MRYTADFAEHLYRMAVLCKWATNSRDFRLILGEINVGSFVTDTQKVKFETTVGPKHWMSSAIDLS
jgi:hypothetical protein